MRKKDAAGLLALVRELQARMAPEKTVSIAVMASTDPQEYVARGYRLAELGAAVDTLALMTYDQHGPWSGPGPIGALPWQRPAVAWSPRPCRPRRSTSGWPGTATAGATGGPTPSSRPAGRSRGTGPRRAVEGARRVDGPALRRQPDVVVRRPLVRLRLALATELGLHGVALWRLGSADPLP